MKNILVELDDLRSRNEALGAENQKLRKDNRTLISRLRTLENSMK